MSWTFYNSSGEALVQHAESEATKAQMEAETASPLFVPPDLVKNSPGVAKCWCVITAAGAIESPSYNVASIDDNSTGNRDINFTTAFSSNVYATAAIIMMPGDDMSVVRVSGIATGAVNIQISNSSGVIDIRTSQAIFGDQ
jgi:hypothetical protein